MLLVVLGVLVAGGAGALAGLAIADNPAGRPKYTPEMLGQSLPTLNGAARLNGCLRCPCTWSRPPQETGLAVGFALRLVLDCDLSG